MLDDPGLARANVSIGHPGVVETSLNSYVARKHVILVGILHRDLAELDNHNIGQHDKISTQTSPEELKAISLSERAHCAYQALSRGCCRVMESAGQATTMTGYVVEYEDTLEDLLKSGHGLVPNGRPGSRCTQTSWSMGNWFNIGPQRCRNTSATSLQPCCNCPADGSGQTCRLRGSQRRPGSESVTRRLRRIFIGNGKISGTGGCRSTVSFPL